MPGTEQIVDADFEEVHFFRDQPTGLRSIIAVHSTQLGPALGGTRFFPYDSEGAALRDVLRLARGMTYKAAVAGLDLGGGKAVIIGDPCTAKSERLLAAYGRCVESLSGRYITASDIGTSEADLDIVGQHTRFVVGRSTSHGGSGDSATATALGVVAALHATMEHTLGDAQLSGRHVSIQGVGQVGARLAGLLTTAGCVVTVADVNSAAVDRLVAASGVRVVDVADVSSVGCDVFAPCAMGGILNPEVIAGLRCRAVVGSANNQLATLDCARLMQDRGILWAPDYVVSAGGLINVADELAGYDRERALRRVSGIYETTLDLLRLADQLGVSPAEAAERRAEERLGLGTARSR